MTCKMPRTKGQPSTSGHKRAADDGGKQPSKKLKVRVQSSTKKKVFNDSVHGHIELHPLLVVIIDTPEFQRLRFIKQTGMCYFVYPGASHNRFEHSIGVCHLAGELARHLQSQQDDLNITEEDILCVEIAGLCHDLGHGPFSHLFDKLFLPEVLKGRTVKHEDLSVDMFDHMLKKHELTEKFKEFNLTDDHIVFIREMMLGVSKKDRTSIIGQEKGFFFDVVANKRNGIDVDRWDYLARDSLNLGISNLFDWRRYLTFARVLTHGRDQQICIRDKEINNLYDMFHTRYTIHSRACQHKVTTVLEIMIADALIAAKDHKFFPGKNGVEKSLLQSIDDMEAYSKVTDSVMWQIISCSKKSLAESRNLINRIFTRDFYVCIGQTQLKKLPKQVRVAEKATCKQIHKKFMKHWKAKKSQKSKKQKPLLKESDIVTHIAEFDYGKQEKNPVKNIKFYRKNVPDETVGIRKIIQNSMALPKRFSENFLRVFSKKSDSAINELISEAFKDWCTSEGLSPKPGDI